MTWQQFIDYLQENLNFTHIRALDISHKMKICRQLLDQFVNDFIAYINILKTQIPVSLSNYVKYFNLLKVLHPYLRNAVIKRLNEVVSKTKLEKITRLVEKNE